MSICRCGALFADGNSFFSGLEQIFQMHILDLCRFGVVVADIKSTSLGPYDGSCARDWLRTQLRRNMANIRVIFFIFNTGSLKSRK